MKKIFSLVILGFLLTGINEIKAQKIPIVDADNMLVRLKESLPVGWEFVSQIKGVLIIQKNENVYVLFENMINAPVNTETKEELDSRIKKYGKLMKPHFEFKYYDKLTDEYIESTKKKNDSVYSVIKKLPKKYNIENLKDKFASSKGEDIYTGNTEEEKEKIKKYEIEKYNLLDKIIKLPDYNSEKYSLYIDSKVGISDEFHLVYPFETSAEMYGLYELFDKYLIKVNR